jgi:hypothetical protein
MSAKLIPVSQIENRILSIRGQKVILDRDLAALYGVETKALNQAVRRNRERFPKDFMFQLNWEESAIALRSQFVTLNVRTSRDSASKSHRSRSQFVTLINPEAERLNRGHNVKFRPYAFTEQGVAMLSSVLRSPRAVQVNIEIMRTFVRLRQWLASNAELAARLDKLEQSYDKKFKVVFEAIRELMREKTAPQRKREIGFHAIPVLPEKSGAKTQQRISV